MNDLEQMYQEVILEESREPFHKVYQIDDPNKSHQYNPTCGDEITMSVVLGRGASDGVFDKNADDVQNKLNGDSKQDVTIEKIEFAGEGCSISQASASIMIQLLEEKSVSEAFGLVELFKRLMNSRGVDDAENGGLSEQELDKLGDATVFLGTAKFPARIKCALLGWAAFEGAVANNGVATETNKHTE